MPAALAIKSKVLNGVDVSALESTVAAIKANGEIAKFNFRAVNRWMGGDKNRSTIKEFTGALSEQREGVQAFVADNGEHPILLGHDEAPNPIEWLLHAMIGCMTTATAYHAAANGIAIEALKRNLRVVAKPTHRLLFDLQIARSNGAYPRMLARILSCDLLLLDDFGLQAITPQAAQDLYEIITERYEKGSLIITSNRAFEEWGEIFSNDLLASAALDRLTHHSHALVIRGDSYRQRSRRKEIASINLTSDAPLIPES